MRSSLCLVFLSLVLLFTSSPAAAQGPPGTDILLVALSGNVISPDAEVKNLTNRDGYDNQPFFTPDGTSLLYTSIREDGQADIYRIDLESHDQFRLTQTSESEYSPTPVPSGDSFSTIRVEEDGSQRLWAFESDGEHPSLLLEHVKPVGYHAWADAYTVVMFVLGDSLSPNTLQMADIRTGKAQTLSTRVGRSLHRIPGTATVSFVQKGDDNTWIIKALDPSTKEVNPIIATRPNREDYAWHPDGTLYMGDGSVLYARTPESDDWHVAYDFSSAGAKEITRLAVHPQGTFLALVVNR